MSSKPALVLVHGAWHNAKCWDGIKAELEKLGYEVVTPSLLSMVQRPAVASHMEDVAVVRKEIETLVNAGKEVVVVMHSYGGLAGGGAIEGLEKGTAPKGGVIAALFLTAFLAPKGLSLLSQFDSTPPYLAPLVG
jgi:pimeloyl-ACP methyl ester carboxylesterase